MFSLSENVLEKASGSVFTLVKPLGERKMIETGGAFTNFGIKMNVPANSIDDVFQYPRRPMLPT